jgi:hypothetical protein
MSLVEAHTARQMLLSLDRMYRVTYPETREVFQRALQAFANDSDPAPAIEWARGAETVFPQGQAPWV